MAYMRGDAYIWDDESGFHFWAKDGYDNWDDSGWACTENEDGSYARDESYKNASGTSVPEDITDAFVMMRLARLIYEGRIEKVIENSKKHCGNFGAMMFEKNAEKIKAALVNLELESTEPYVWPDKNS